MDQRKEMLCAAIDVMLKFPGIISIARPCVNDTEQATGFTVSDSEVRVMAGDRDGTTTIYAGDLSPESLREATKILVSVLVG